MALALTAEQKDLLSIFKIEAQYIIPAYQRPYSWEYDECLQLYADVMDAFESGEDYFIGNIVIAKSNSDKDKVEVIDGQQRLTTLLLFIKVLSILAPDVKNLHLCLEREDWENNKQPRIQSEIFEASDAEQFTEVLGLVCREDFDDRMATFKDQKGIFNTKKFPNRFERNALFFYSWVEFYNRKNDIKEFVKFLLQRIYLLPIELTGQTFDEAGEKALKIFETLNNRGKSLDDADIFKAKLYDKAKKIQEQEAFIESWADLKSRCDLMSIKIDDVFRYYSHVIRGREGKTSLEINIREFFTKLDYSPFQLKSYNEILDELFVIVEVVEYINEEKNKSTELAKWLQLVDIYTNQYPKIALIVYIFIHKDSLDRESITIAFLKKLIRFAYYAGSTSTIKFTIFNIIRDISVGKEIEEYLKPDITTDYFTYLGMLKKGYALLAAYLRQDKAFSRYSIEKRVDYKKIKGFLWTDDQKYQVTDGLGNLIIRDKSVENLGVVNFSQSKIRGINELSMDPYEECIDNDKMAKNILVDFFKGEL